MNFPCYEDGQTISAAVVSAAAALTGDANRILAARDLLFYNPGPYLVHVKTGGASVAATTANTPVLPGAVWAYGKGNATHIATLSVGGAQQLVVWLGEGS